MWKWKEKKKNEMKKGGKLTKRYKSQPGRNGV